MLRAETTTQLPQLPLYRRKSVTASVLVATTVFFGACVSALFLIGNDHIWLTYIGASATIVDHRQSKISNLLKKK